MTDSASNQITLFGRLDAIVPDDSGGTATGWCWSPQEPAKHREVALVAGGRRVATTRCDEPRPALRSVGMGDGAHAFTVRVPRHLFSPAAGAVTVTLEDIETGQQVGAPLTYAYGAAPNLAAGHLAHLPSLRAVLERVEEEGLVRGWCWSPTEPDRRVRLLILVDNQPVGVAVADLMRQDLKEAGIGDGCHGFQFLLPWEAISNKSSSQITLADEATGRALPASTIFRHTTVRPIEERLRELEHQVRLLNARLDESGSRANRDAQVVSAMLATIGAFFTRLSETTLESIPSALVPSLTDLVDRTRDRLPPLTLALVSDPELTVVIGASGTIDGIYACLHSIHASGLDQNADIVLIDDGSVSEAALFPSLVLNLRYWRLQPGQSISDARNRIAGLAPHRPIAFFAAGTRLNPEWWPALRATFAREPLCAVLGTKLVRPDGFVAAGGLLADPRGQLIDFAEAHHEHDPAIDMLQAVIAAPDVAMVIDGAAFARFGGFDTSFIDPAAAAIAFCINCWDNGRSVLYQPAAALRWQNDSFVLAATRPVADPDISAVLTHRWFAASRPAWPVPVGDALLIDAAAPDGAEPDGASDQTCVDMAAALRQLGWRVSVGVIGRLETEDPRAPLLRSLGVQVLRAPFHPSIAAAIEATGQRLGLIQLSLAAARALPPARLRALAPHAFMILSLAGIDAPADDAPANWLCDAVAASHCTLVGDARLAAALTLQAPPAKVCRLSALHRPGYAQRAGIGLILPADGAASRTAMMWFTRSIWPRLWKALPGVTLYVREQDSDAAPEEAVRYGADVDELTLWRSLRLALAPLRKELPDLALLAKARQVGVPVFACGAAWPSAPAGVSLGASSVGAAKLGGVIREISLLYGDATRWQALHDSMDDPALTAEEWVLGFRALLGEHKLPMNPPATQHAA